MITKQDRVIQCVIDIFYENLQDTMLWHIYDKRDRDASVKKFIDRQYYNKTCIAQLLSGFVKPSGFAHKVLFSSYHKGLAFYINQDLKGYSSVSFGFRVRANDLLFSPNRFIVFKSRINKGITVRTYTNKMLRKRWRITLADFAGMLKYLQEQARKENGLC